MRSYVGRRAADCQYRAALQNSRKVAPAAPEASVDLWNCVATSLCYEVSRDVSSPPACARSGPPVNRNSFGGPLSGNSVRQVEISRDVQTRGGAVRWPPIAAIPRRPARVRLGCEVSGDANPARPS
jgi:hypothetical protein